MKQKLIQVNGVEYTYVPAEIERCGVTALTKINLEISQGEFVAVIGRNGSGKSTLARLMNALLIPTLGDVIIDGMSTHEENNTWSVHKTVGMVFQNPDNQLVGTVVEEDIAFGLENVGIKTEEIIERVDYALSAVGLLETRNQSPHQLSGGQKQLVAVAGMLALKPKAIVLDEATSMLDPLARTKIIKVLKELNQKEHITIVHMTNHMDEAVMADRIIVLDQGLIVMDGTPQEVFSDVSVVKALGLEVPQVTELLYELNCEGYDFKESIFNVEDAFYEILRRL